MGSSTEQVSSATSGRLPRAAEDSFTSNLFEQQGIVGQNDRHGPRVHSTCPSRCCLFVYFFSNLTIYTSAQMFSKSFNFSLSLWFYRAVDVVTVFISLVPIVTIPFSNFDETMWQEQFPKERKEKIRSGIAKPKLCVSYPKRATEEYQKVWVSVNSKRRSPNAGWVSVDLPATSHLDKSVLMVIRKQETIRNRSTSVTVAKGRWRAAGRE